MNLWLQVLVYAVAAAGLVACVVLLVRDEAVGDRVYLTLAVAEVLLLVQVVTGSVALAGTARDVSGVLFVSYLVGVALVLPIGAFWSLAERNRSGTAVLALALATVLALELRLVAIWNGAGA